MLTSRVGLFLDLVRRDQYNQRSHFDLIASLYILESADAHAAKGRGCRMFCNPGHVGSVHQVLVRPTDNDSSVIGAVIAQLVLLGQHRRSQDITFDNWSYYLSTQFVQNLGVITACVPYIKNALLGLESGMFQTGHFHLATLRKELRKPPQSESSGTTSGNGTTVRGSEQHGDRSHHHMPHSVAADIIPRLTPWYGRNTATAEPVTPTEEWDVESHCSGARIIKQTREVLVARE